MKGLTIEQLLDAASLSEEEKQNALETLKSLTKERKEADKSAAVGLGDTKINHYRVNTMVEIISKLCSIGLSEEVIRKTIIEFNNSNCDPPVDQNRLEREVFPAIDRWKESAIERDVADNRLVKMLERIKPEYFKHNDRGNGEVFAIVFKDYLRWNKNAKCWMYYNGKVWKRDECGLVASRYSKLLFDALMKYIPIIANEEIVEKYSKHAAKLGSLSQRKTMLEDAKDKYCLSGKVFDTNNYYLNLQNGVYDLKNFKLLDHKPGYFLSKICNVAYDEDAKSEKWLNFIDQIFQGDQEKIDYIQKVIGYSLTGVTKEEQCFFLYGNSTRNGKSTLVETIGYMLGEVDGYSLSMNPETLAQKSKPDSSRPSSDLARLKDCRFLIAAEPPKKMILNASILKRLTGDDTITARFLNENDIQFKPKFKAFMNTNHLPIVEDESIFDSDRIKVITFDKHFEEHERNKDLKEELRDPAEMSGILNWCLEGLRKYYQEGLTAPECVVKATREYRSSADKVGAFLEECLVYKKDNRIKAQDVFDKYNDWSRYYKFTSVSKGAFFEALRKKNRLRKTATMYRYEGDLKKSYTEKNVVVNYELKEPDFEKEPQDE